MGEFPQTSCGHVPFINCGTSLLNEKSVIILEDTKIKMYCQNRLIFKCIINFMHTSTKFVSYTQ